MCVILLSDYCLLQLMEKPMEIFSVKPTNDYGSMFLSSAYDHLKNLDYIPRRGKHCSWELAQNKIDFIFVVLIPKKDYFG